MKLVTFQVQTSAGPAERLGALLDSLPGQRERSIVDLNFADASIPADMIAFLGRGQDAIDAAKKVIDASLDSRLRGNDGKNRAGNEPRLIYREDEVRLLAPVPRPGALRDFFSFEDHAKQGAARRGEEIAPEWYEQPIYYKGNHREIYGPGDTVPWPSYTRRFDFELEIACVVGTKGRDLSIEEAEKHIAGYTILNDFSARDIQKNEMICRMGPAKGKDFGTGLGPWLVTADEVGDLKALKMAVKVNGEIWSRGEFSKCYWSFPLMLSHVSQGETVYPGDILGSGTYYTGCGLDLNRWVGPGDVIELEVDKLGVLKQTVGAPTGQKHLKYGEAPKKQGTGVGGQG